MSFFYLLDKFHLGDLIERNIRISLAHVHPKHEKSASQVKIVEKKNPLSFSRSTRQSSTLKLILHPLTRIEIVFEYSEVYFYYCFLSYLLFCTVFWLLLLTFTFSQCQRYLYTLSNFVHHSAAALLPV